MTAKEILLKVKAAFLGEPVAAPAAAAAPPATPAAPAAQTYKTKDGQDVSIAIKDPTVTTEPSVGDAVTIAGAPAPAGDIELEDGTKITVDATGAIANIVAAGPETQPDFTAPPAPTMEERLASIEQELAKMKQPGIPTGCATVEQFSEVKGQFEAANKTISKQDEVIKGLFELCEKLVEVPSADPETLTGSKKEKFEKQNAKERKLQAMADELTKMKNKNRNPAIV